MQWWEQCVGGLVVASTLLSACAVGARAPLTADVSVSDVWLAAIIGAHARADGRALVDPRSMKLRVDGIMPSPEAYNPIESVELDRRVATLQAAGIDTISMFPRLKCGGMLVPPPFRDTSGCPEEPFAVMIFDEPLFTASSQWTVRMSEIFYDTNRSTGGIYDITVGLRDGRPVFLSQVVRVVIE